MRSKPPDSRLSGVQTAFCAGSAAAVSRLVVQPISTCKIFTEVGCPGGRMGISRTLFWFSRKEGLKALFTRGSVAAGARAFPHYAIMVGAYDRLVKQWVPKGPSGFDPPSLEHIISVYLAGAAAGTLATLVTHPMDLVKVRLVAQPLGIENHYYKNTTDAFKTILTKEGIYRGIYRGLAPSLIGGASFAGNMFLLLYISENFPWRKRGKPYFYLAWLLWPCVSVGGAVFITHPLDLIRRKYMAQSFVLPKEGNVDCKFRNIFQLVTQMYKWNSLWSFYQGVVPNLIKIVPQVVTFTILYNGLQSGLLTFMPARQTLNS